MDQELETAQAYMESKNYDSAFNILHKIGNCKESQAASELN